MPTTINADYFSIQNLIKTELPPLPASVMRVSTLLDDFNVSHRAIADAISLDPILSSRILRLANSPVYALHGTVTNLASAVATVGNNSISEMLMISGVSDSFGRKVLCSKAGKEIWYHSLATAMTASEICYAAKMRGADEAFSCGLLHDIGKLILLRADAPLYLSLLERASDEETITMIEREVLGFDHAELGADAAVSWGLPGTLSHMIRCHHNPSDAKAGLAMAHIINIADKFVTLKTDKMEIDELVSSEPVKALGLDVSQFDAIWEKVTVRLNEVLETFN
jgi:putative nucleotidyltransferase with HDIG domain